MAALNIYYFPRRYSFDLLAKNIQFIKGLTYVKESVPKVILTVSTIFLTKTVDINLFFLCLHLNYYSYSRPRWSRGNVLASRFKVRGFKSG